MFSLDQDLNVWLDAGVDAVFGHPEVALKDSLRRGLHGGIEKVTRMRHLFATAAKQVLTRNNLVRKSISTYHHCAYRTC